MNDISERMAGKPDAELLSLWRSFYDNPDWVNEIHSIKNELEQRNIPIPDMQAERRGKERTARIKFANVLAALLAAIMLTFGYGALWLVTAYVIGAGIGYAIKGLRVQSWLHVVLAACATLILLVIVFVFTAMLYVKKFTADIESSAPSTIEESVLSPAEQARMLYLYSKALSGMDKKTQERFLKLHAMRVEDLSSAEFIERLALATDALSLLPDAEQMEWQTLSTRASIPARN
jgi:uncharacterized membrane protein YhdT